MGDRPEVVMEIDASERHQPVSNISAETQISGSVRFNLKNKNNIFWRMYCIYWFQYRTYVYQILFQLDIEKNVVVIKLYQAASAVHIMNVR